MGKKDTLTLRFCFGTADHPGSAVWRINIFLKKGDVYLHNAPQSGNNIHIALHASGIFSAKLGTDRHKLQPPFKDSNGLYWGPVMFFFGWPREVPPPPPSGQTEKIQWLGWPKEKSQLIVKLLYVPTNVVWVRHNEDRLVFGDISVRLFHAEMLFHVLVQEQEISPAERDTTAKRQIVEFSGSHAEMIRISKTELGQSAIIHEPFVMSYSTGPNNITGATVL